MSFRGWFAQMWDQVTGNQRVNPLEEPLLPPQEPEALYDKMCIIASSQTKFDFVLPKIDRSKFQEILLVY